MKLSNFSLSSPVQTITLVGLGFEWDLHNFAEFVQLAHDPFANVAYMVWRVPSMDNPWGCPSNKAVACRLKFLNLELIKVTPNQSAFSDSEAMCLSGMSKVDPSRAEYRFKRVWDESEPFNLLFEFQSGRSIEIACETAELEAGSEGVKLSAPGFDSLVGEG